MKASVELQGIKGMWSLRCSTDDPYDTFLVVSFISETRILAMNIEDELEETEIEGFCSQVQTLFCHDAVYNQLVQVGFFLLPWMFSLKVYLLLFMLGLSFMYPAHDISRLVTRQFFIYQGKIIKRLNPIFIGSLI